MYRTIKETRKFDTDKEKDLEDFDDLINNPNVTILTRDKEKIQDKTFDEDGKLSSIHEHIVWVVTWEEKKLC